MQPKQMPLSKCIQAAADFSHSLCAVCFSYVLRWQVGSSCSSMWILKDPIHRRGNESAWLWSWLCTPAICINLHTICISSLITAQMCGKYRFNQLTVGKQSNLSCSLEPAISWRGIRSEVNCCSDGLGFSQANQAASHGHPDTLPCLSTLFWFPLLGSDNFF